MIDDTVRSFSSFDCFNTRVVVFHYCSQALLLHLCSFLSLLVHSQCLLLCMPHAAYCKTSIGGYSITFQFPADTTLQHESYVAARHMLIRTYAKNYIIFRVSQVTPLPLAWEVGPPRVKILQARGYYVYYMIYIYVSILVYYIPRLSDDYTASHLRSRA